MKIKTVKNPQWANRSKTAINLTVRFEEINEDLPFTATANDSEAHSRELFTKAKQGVYGQVKEFAAIPLSNIKVEQLVRTERDKRLSESDWTQAADVPQSIKDKWASYRQSLRDLPQQVDFPWNNLVVTESDFGFTIDVTKAPFPKQPV
jgi:hypothetical protein